MTQIVPPPPALAGTEGKISPRSLQRDPTLVHGPPSPPAPPGRTLEHRQISEPPAPPHPDRRPRRAAAIPAPSGSETEPPTAHRDRRRLHTPERRREPSARHRLPRAAAARPERTPTHTRGNREREPCRRPQARAGAPRLQRAANPRRNPPAPDPASCGRRDPAAANAGGALPGGAPWQRRGGEVGGGTRTRWR
nr:translation initiation factor IF-2-like [Aegilops tauschii subsp. strangulata]